MVGNDRRGDLGAFEVYYFFAHTAENWFLHARKTLPAREPAVGSLDLGAQLGTASLDSGARRIAKPSRRS